jgi:hypothetical protein
MTLTAQQETIWRRELLLELARAAGKQVRPFVPSRTLRNSLIAGYGVNQGGDSSAGYVVIPFFWALYVHDGRGGFGVHDRFRHGRRKPSVLVWFADPKDDPRTLGGKDYPRREKDIRQLTKQQYLAGLRENRKRRRLKARPYMIVTKAVLYTTPARPFFDEGLRTFPQRAEGIIQKRWSGLIRSQVFSDRDVARIRV